MYAAVGRGEVSAWVVADHKDLLGLKAHLGDAGKVIVCRGLAARAVFHGGDQLKGHIEHIAPAHAALDARAAEAGVGEQRAAKTARGDRIDGLARALARTGVDDAVVFAGQNLALVVGKHICYDGVAQRNAAPALDLLLEECQIGVIIVALSVVEGVERGAKRREHGKLALAGDVRQQRRLVACEDGNESAQVDAEQRIIHIENHGFEHGYLPLAPTGATAAGQYVMCTQYGRG